MSINTNAPLRIGTVALVVHDLDAVRDYYLDAIGLADLGGDADVARLGAGDAVLLELRRDRAARRRGAREPGLFHTAFLLPDRAALANWAEHASRSSLRLQGASDHTVSEAFYLADPEGNGIEIYADRAPETWVRTGERVLMDTRRLDTEDLMTASTAPDWRGLPASTVVGHVHLQVGDDAAAERFAVDVLGLSLTAREPAAGWFGSGGYHHHLAANVWNSLGAGAIDARAGAVRGLASVGLVARDANVLDAVRERARAGSVAIERDEGASFVLHDPWGTRFDLRSAA